MVSLFSRELKFFFTSPLFISLEFIPLMIMDIIIYTSLPQDQIYSLIPIIWLMVVFFYTYLELEMWRKGFLNKGVKLKVYVSTSPIFPLLAHSLVSLILLELKTLVVWAPLAFEFQLFSSQPGELLKIVLFIMTTHAYWLFSISIGSIFSKDVFDELADPTAMLLCIATFGIIGSLVIYPFMGQSGKIIPIPSLNATIDPLSSSLVLFISIMLYGVALYANSKSIKNIRIDGL
ncbi:MAG: hypothetical protein ACUVQY_05670 [Thermoproteota archaeon]